MGKAAEIIQTVKEKWPYMLGVAVVFTACSSSPSDPDRYFATYQAGIDTPFSIWLPVAADPVCALNDKAGIEAVTSFISKMPFLDCAGDEIGDIDATDAPVAPDEALREAIDAVQNEPGQHCPTGKFKKYKVPIQGDSDPSAHFCLNTDSSLVVQQLDGDTSVYMKLELNKNYPRKSFFSIASHFNEMNIDECLAGTKKIRTMGQAMLLATGKIPDGYQAPVSLTAEDTEIRGAVLCQDAPAANPTDGPR